MKLRIFFFFYVLLIGCNNDKTLVESFEINFRSKGTLVYDNSECEFDNRSSQSQFNGSSVNLSNEPKAFQLFSNYENRDGADSTLNQFWLTLVVEYSNDEVRFSSEYLESLLDSEDSNENTKHLYPQVQVEVCGKRFDNEDRVIEPGESVYRINDNFKYSINDFDVLYQSDCIERELLFLDISLEGMLYRRSLTNENDSIYLDESRIKVLFDIE